MGEDTPEEITAIAADCWHQDPRERPSFGVVMQLLEDFAERAAGEEKTFLFAPSRSSRVTELRPAVNISARGDDSQFGSMQTLQLVS